MQVERDQPVLALAKSSGERVSNTWETYPGVGNNSKKFELIPHTFLPSNGGLKKDLSLWEGLAAYQLVGEVTAHQGIDG